MAISWHIHLKLQTTKPESICSQAFLSKFLTACGIWRARSSRGFAFLGDLLVAGQFEAVTGPVYGFDVPRMAGIGFHLGSQVSDVYANCFDVVVWVVAPDFFENFAGRDCLTVALQQAVQQLEL